MEDTLAFYGSEVKALGNGKVGGYAVLYTKEPDLQGDIFTKSTNFYLRDGDERPILYRHGMHPVIKSRQLGRGKLTFDDVGIFLEAELELRDNYEKAIYKLAEMGKLGYSTGSMGHLVSKTAKNKSFEIDAWPIGEVSLTPNPVEARTTAFPLKAMDDIDLEAFIKSLEPKEEERYPFDIAGAPAIAKFCEDVSPSSVKDGLQRSESAATAIKEFITVGNILGEAFLAHKSRLVRHTENRFVKDNRQISPADAMQVEQSIAAIERVETVLTGVKSDLLGIRKLSELSKVQQKAMDAKARLALWNYYRISGTQPKELENGTSTG